MYIALVNKNMTQCWFSIPASFDYVPVNKTLLFSPPVDQHCVKIHIVNDTLQESEESFVVDIISPEGINISHTEVSISPSNGKSLFVISFLGGGRKREFHNYTMQVSGTGSVPHQMTVVVRMAVSLW